MNENTVKAHTCIKYTEGKWMWRRMLQHLTMQIEKNIEFSQAKRIKRWMERWKRGNEKVQKSNKTPSVKSENNGEKYEF